MSPTPSTAPMVDAPTISIDEPAGRARRPRAARLRVVFPRELRGPHDLSRLVTTLGRAPGPGTFSVPHATVSRRHAEIRWSTSDHHVVRDLGSRHGTQVGGRALPADGHPLVDGDVLRLGDALLVYELAAGDDDPAVDRGAVPGEAPAIAALRGQLARAATDPAAALLIGDTGTGKEWVARELHRLSGRRGPLIAVNCATLSPQLAESQLFGHVKGAFTGATAEADGWFRQAEGGTLFLDELGELPLELQPKLLRVVQDGVVQPLGASRAVTVDVRLCCATNRDLAAEVERGRFRRDLYARMARQELRLPSLAARRGDVLDWIDRLWNGWAAARGRRLGLPTWRASAARAILAHAWPDNLRGLERLVHELASRGAPARPFDVDDLPGWLIAPPASAPPVAEVDAARAARPPVPTRAELVAAWTAHGGSVRALARHFGRDRRQIYRWVEAYGLRASDDAHV
jgi:DNA-binding NtrC family response regulator